MDDDKPYEPPPIHLRPRPASLDEAAKHLVETLPKESIAELRAMDQGDLIDTHWGLALYVRNHYILDQLFDETRLTPSGRWLIDDDEVSAEIVLRAWTLLQP